MGSRSYVLVTAAYNEGAFIGTVIEAVLSQTLRPARWIIVSDGSTDGTDGIVRRHAEQNPFIELCRVDEEHARNFAAQVNAINMGAAALTHLDFAYIGNLDADISLEPDYFERLLEKFEADSNLGLAGGAIFEKNNGVFEYRRTNNLRSVAHGVQMFRRACFEQLGGYQALPYGGPDWHAEVSARMRGWTVQSFADLKVFHHRPTGMAGGLLRYNYRQGLMDFSLGSHPGFQVVKCLVRVRSRPFLIGALTRLSGFAWAYCSGEKRHVSREFMAFLRLEQKRRLRSLLSGTAAE